MGYAVLPLVAEVIRTVFMSHRTWDKTHSVGSRRRDEAQGLNRMPVPVTFEVNVAPETLQGTQGSQRDPRAEQPGCDAVMLPGGDARETHAGTQTQRAQRSAATPTRHETKGQALALGSGIDPPIHDP